MVIASNVFVGLAVTAVYRYADAVIKCFATAVSTGVLLYVSPIFFNVEFSYLVIPGTVLIFVATWLYLEAAPRKRTKDKDNYKHSPFTKRAPEFLTQRFPRVTLTIGMIITTVIVAFLTTSDTRMLTVKRSNNGEDVKICDEGSQVVGSPFKNSLAYVRWASERPERMPFLSNVIFYAPLADTMKIILASPSSEPEASIDGIMNFHFDAWIDPLSFVNENLSLIQYATSPDPRLRCAKSLSRYPDYWGWGPNHLFHEQALSAVRAVESLDLGYDVDPNEWCVGWSDILYIPRRFFADFIYLSHIFASFNVFHEVAVPTMVNIIDRTHRQHGRARSSVVNYLEDCYGSCCSPGATVEDVLEKRCGHRLDYRGDAAVISATYDRLDREAAMLGSKLEGDPHMSCEMLNPSKGHALNVQRLQMIDQKMGDLRAKGMTEKPEGLDAVDRSVHG